jgi:hypothetical protein
MAYLSDMTNTASLYGMKRSAEATFRLAGLVPEFRKQEEKREWVSEKVDKEIAKILK